MAATIWQYVVPYEGDFDAALDRLKAEVFASGRFHWCGGPRPATIAEVWADDIEHECGTHSILDMFRVQPPNEKPKSFTVSVVTPEEVEAHLGHSRPTVEFAALLDDLATTRWQGRCAVLYDEAGTPTSLRFWGASGD
ncbi:hypothetical protein [Saccharothrix violaceirubra]|uniref:Uncharacterized protein n=1 Tax=Saccharothrix violaceirubra TaxID=413306 RepID=A0A7W7WV78_9PSEU|nr:hypothetical protein [Saccharothrix violaceirubra]MBB4964652.1 hypothetical protein [Saccharothrix violaceirubra]